MIGLEEFYRSLTPEQQEKLRPYLEAERAAMIREQTRTMLYSPKRIRYKNERSYTIGFGPKYRRTLV